MTIIIEDQEVIDGQYKTSKVFFDKILGMSVDECLITDNSCLSDFVGSGDFYFDAERDLKEIYDAWDVFVLNK